MYMNYLFYLNTLSITEKNKQIIISVLLIIVIFAITGITEFLNLRHKTNENKEIK